MRLLNFTRGLGAAGALLVAFAAAPAFAQANVTVTLAAPADGILVASEQVEEPVTNDYEVVITNAAGADAATGVTLTVTALPTPLKIRAFLGCSRSAADPTSCTLAAPIAPGGTATVVIQVLYPVEDPLPATCPTGLTVGAFTVSVVAANDATPATATVATTPVNPWADVVVTATPPSSNISSGETQTIHMAVKNNGPCTADAVAAEFSFPTALQFQSAQDTTQGGGTFCAGGVPLDAEDAVPGPGGRPAGAFADLGCDMGDLARDEERSFDAVFTLASLPDDLIRGAYPFAVTASATAMHDPNPDNSTGTAPGRFEKDDSGCSTGGAGTLLGALALLALRLGRRRPA